MIRAKHFHVTRKTLRTRVHFTRVLKTLRVSSKCFARPSKCLRDHQNVCAPSTGNRIIFNRIYCFRYISYVKVRVAAISFPTRSPEKFSGNEVEGDWYHISATKNETRNFKGDKINEGYDMMRRTNIISVYGLA